MRVPVVLHETFKDILNHARWYDREAGFVVRSSQANLETWQQFLKTVRPVVEALNDVASEQCSAQRAERTEDAALQALEDARKSLSHAKSRAAYACDRLKAIAGSRVLRRAARVGRETGPNS